MPATLESAPAHEEINEVDHAQESNEKPAALEATAKEAVVESEVPVAEDEAPRSALKSSPEAAEHHETHD